MNSCEIVSLVTAVSCTISKCVPEDELPLLITILGQIAATLATVLENEEANKPKNKVSDVTPDATPNIVPEVIPDIEIITEPTNVSF